jgi:hypothetical protein
VMNVTKIYLCGMLLGLAALTAVPANAQVGGMATPPPLPPTAFSYTQGTSQITLQWHRSRGAASYNLYRGTTASGETRYAKGLADLTYVDTSLQSGVTYYYQVAAVNSIGEEGNRTNEASIATPTPSSPRASSIPSVHLTYAPYTNWQEALKQNGQSSTVAASNKLLVSGDLRFGDGLDLGGWYDDETSKRQLWEGHLGYIPSHGVGFEAGEVRWSNKTAGPNFPSLMPTDEFANVVLSIATRQDTLSYGAGPYDSEGRYLGVNAFASNSYYLTRYLSIDLAYWYVGAKQSVFQSFNYGPWMRIGSYNFNSSRFTAGVGLSF